MTKTWQRWPGMCSAAHLFLSFIALTGNSRMSLVNGQGQTGAAGLVNPLIPQSSGQAYWWDNRPPPPPPIYSCYRGWDSSHYDQVMGTFMQKPLHADLRSTMCEANCTNIAFADYNATRWCVTLELSEIGPYVYDCLPNISPKITCTDVNRTGSVFLHGRKWTYHCCRATNKEGYPPGTANPEEARCQDKAILISRSFEKAAVVNGSVAGCLEFADRVIYTPLCGTAPSECHTTTCAGCTVLYKSVGNHTWCLPQYTHPNLYERPKAPSRQVCASNNLPATLGASFRYGYTARVTEYHNFSTAPRKTPDECTALNPNDSRARWLFPSTRPSVENEMPGTTADASVLGPSEARLPVEKRCWLDPYFDDADGTCISLTAELAISKSTTEIRAAWSCYSVYMSYLGIACPAGGESASVSVETLYDAAVKAERLDEVFASLKDFLRNKKVTPLSVCNRTHSRILQQLAHLPPKIDFTCCKGHMCNAPRREVGACFMGESTRSMTDATSTGQLPPHVQNVARSCLLDVPGATSGSCVSFTQQIFGRTQTTGMCYSDVLKAAYSGMDWIGLKVDCTTNANFYQYKSLKIDCTRNASAEDDLYLFDNIPNTTDSITPPPPETGYLQQNAGEAGARFDSMRAAADPVARPTLRKVELAARIRYKCCQGLLCNTEARPNGDFLLNFSSNVTAILAFNGFASRRAGRDFLIEYAQELRDTVAGSLAKAFPRVSASDVILSSICSSSDGCRMLLSFPCRDEKCRQADAKREQRRQLLEALPFPNVSVVVDFQVNLNDSENASHAARLLNTSDFIMGLEQRFGKKSNRTIHVEFINGPLPLVQLSVASTTIASSVFFLVSFAGVLLS